MAHKTINNFFSEEEPKIFLSRVKIFRIIFYVFSVEKRWRSLSVFISIPAGRLTVIHCVRAAELALRTVSFFSEALMIALYSRRKRLAKIEMFLCSCSSI